MTRPPESTVISSRGTAEGSDKLTAGQVDAPVNSLAGLHPEVVELAGTLPRSPNLIELQHALQFTDVEKQWSELKRVCHLNHERDEQVRRTTEPQRRRSRVERKFEAAVLKLEEMCDEFAQSRFGALSLNRNEIERFHQVKSAIEKPLSLLNCTDRTP